MERKDLKNFFSSLKKIISNIDDVLADAGLYYGANWEELKCFNARDSYGIGLAQKNGLELPSFLVMIVWHCDQEWQILI